MKVNLENDNIKALFNTVGAETVSVIDKKKGGEIIWQGSKDSWTGQCPNLFPFVGRLKNGFYTHEGKEYHLSRHGFARNSEFEITEKTDRRIVFSLDSSLSTLAVYPFEFNFSVIYELKDDRLITNYIIKNIDSKTIYFGIGGHPGFNIPYTELEAETKIDGNKITFEKAEEPEEFTFDLYESLITGIRPRGKTAGINLSKKLFEEGEATILFQKLKSKYVTLIRADGVNLRFWFYDAPYLAFWTAEKKGGFICIEPWYGLPDYFEPEREMKNKKGINALKAGEEFKYRYDIQILK